MRMQKALIPLLVAALLLSSACVYVVLPEGLDLSAKAEATGWGAVVTGVSPAAGGGLHVDITIRNATADWSAMSAVDGQPAVLTTADGAEHDCATVFVGTGGHRLAPGFQMRGYTTGTKKEPKTQLIYVECAGVDSGAGASLAIDYISYSGELDYYHQEEGQAAGTLELELDDVAADLTYPIYEPLDGLIQKADVSITALSENVITLKSVQRSADGLEFTWGNYNPTEFALKIHIGNPPVIGSDGVIYGIYEIMDLASVPLTPAGGSVEWTTKVAVPPEVTGLYLLSSVESKNMRLYVNYAIDITDK